MIFAAKWTSVRARQCIAPIVAVTALAGLVAAAAQPAPQQRDRPFDGFNVIAAAGHPFGSADARLALIKARELGARAIAIVPFLWQSSPTSAGIVRGDDMTDDELRNGIDDAHALGFAVVIKPHVWVPKSWAGAIAMDGDQTWKEWFANYQRQLIRISRIADEEKAEAFAVGTELSKTTLQPQWSGLIGAVRRSYHGRLLYVAHNVDEAEAVPFWDRLDDVGVTLYPPLGADADRDGRRGKMAAIAERLDGLGARTGKSIVVGEIGLRSAVGAAARPWESAEERSSVADASLQADVLADWLDVLDRPSIRGVMIWRWFTDPNAGGLTDTDFTVQGKPAERVLMCVWTHRCHQREGQLLLP